jgi:hypothetical protein
VRRVEGLCHEEVDVPNLKLGRIWWAIGTRVMMMLVVVVVVVVMVMMMM